MISRSVAVGLLAAGCVTAAAGGSYLAVRQNAAESLHAQQPAASDSSIPAAAPGDAVTETEAVVSPDPAAVPKTPAVEGATERQPAPAPAARRVERPAARRRAATSPAHEPAPVPPAPQPVTVPTQPVVSAPPAADVLPAAPAPDPEPVFDELVVPASSVIGLELERTITSEQAEVEDRVDARVTRDVYANGRVAIPAGSRVTGTVTLVERGGKLKERARLGVRFHTLVLANGLQLPLRTETIYREGDSPGAGSSRKIGGAAIGGAVLGAILGGGKGAATGAAVGAAGGTAAVMAGRRNPATLASGSVITARLSAPVVIERER